MTISASKRFLIGGVGGLAPVIALLIAVDFERNFVNASNAQIAGYIVRAAALFAIGGFVAWLHDSEVHNFKVFEIGLGAPALIAGVVTSQSLAHAGPKAPNNPAVSPSAAVLFLFPSAHAQPITPLSGPQLTLKAPQPTAAASVAGPGLKPKSFSFPEISRTSEFLEGLVGIRVQRPKDVYYVIAGSHRTLEEASRQAATINNKKPSLPATVYAPFAENPYYAVVIGDRATKAAATELKSKAIDAGVARDTYLWTTPNLRY